MSEFLFGIKCVIFTCIKFFKCLPGWEKIRNIHKQAFENQSNILPIGGIYRYRKNGETHQYQGKLIHLLQTAVTENSLSMINDTSHEVGLFSGSDLRQTWTWFVCKCARTFKFNFSIYCDIVSSCQNVAFYSWFEY